MPRTHIKALTFAPKIPDVLAGECTQTIRPLPSPILRWPASMKEIRKMRQHRERARIRPGDIVLFHGWEGKPYRSPWSWRLKVRVLSVSFTKIYKEGMAVPQVIADRLDIRTHNLGFLPWGRCDELARLDGFTDGEAMGDFFNSTYTLESYNNAAMDDEATKYFQIIRWHWPPLITWLDGKAEKYKDFAVNPGTISLKSKKEG